MRSEPEMRMPYGPGWEDPDWSVQGTPPDESAAMKLEPASDTRPVVSSLAQFMDVVRRFAHPRRARAEAGTQPAGQTRRWVVAGSASFVALAALPSRRKLPVQDDGAADLADAQGTASRDGADPGRREG